MALTSCSQQWGSKNSFRSCKQAPPADGGSDRRSKVDTILESASKPQRPPGSSRSDKYGGFFDTSNRAAGARSAHAPSPAHSDNRDHSSGTNQDLADLCKGSTRGFQDSTAGCKIATRPDSTGDGRVAGSSTRRTGSNHQQRRRRRLRTVQLQRSPSPRFWLVFRILIRLQLA